MNTTASLIHNGIQSPLLLFLILLRKKFLNKKSAKQIYLINLFTFQVKL